jgi:hypothetical protein
MTSVETLLTEREVAKLLRVSVATIRRRRLFRQPPAWIKIGASVRYRPEAVQHLIESATCDPVGQLAANRKAQPRRTGARRSAR